MWRMVLPLTALVAFAAACRPAPPRHEYALRGQVLAVAPADRRITIRHDDIKDFMPAMTMPFKVRDEALIKGLVPGDLVTGTLVVLEDQHYLSALNKTGHAELPPPEPPPIVADVMSEGDVAPDDPLLDQSGRPFALSSWRGHAVALTFIYTRCPMPEYCPLMDRQFAAIQKAVGADDRLRGKVRLLSVSFDPDFDTPAVLAAHATHVGADPAVWTFATADRAVIDRFAPRYGVTVIRGEAGPGSITHNLRTAVIDGAGKLVKIHSGNDWTPDEILADLRTAVARGR
jgi:protein SCO1